MCYLSEKKGHFLEALGFSPNRSAWRSHRGRQRGSRPKVLLHLDLKGAPWITMDHLETRLILLQKKHAGKCGCIILMIVIYIYIYRNIWDIINKSHNHIYHKEILVYHAIFFIGYNNGLWRCVMVNVILYVHTYVIYANTVDMGMNQNGGTTHAICRG